MPSVLDLRRRIRSVKNTRQMTKAMKMVAAAKLRRAQQHAISSRPYAAMLASVIESLKRRVDVIDPRTGELRHPLLKSRAESRALMLVVTGDKGFAGAFNANIVKTAVEFIDSRPSLQIDVEAIGHKGRDLFHRRYPAAEFVNIAKETGEPEADPQAGPMAAPRLLQERARVSRVEVTGDHPDLLSHLTVEYARTVAEEVEARYTNEEIDSAYIVYNQFKSVIEQRVVVERILPIIEFGRYDIASAREMSPERRAHIAHVAMTSGVSVQPGELEASIKEFEDEAKKFGTSNVDYIYDQRAREIFEAILPRYVTSQIYHAMLESVAAEHAARMTAMDSATNNASDMIDSLTLSMNRVRQAAITKEIIEIVSGAAAT